MKNNSQLRTLSSNMATKNVTTINQNIKRGAKLMMTFI